MNNILRNFLLCSAIVAVAVALIIFSFIIYKVIKIKRKMKQYKLNVLEKISSNDSKQKLINRADFDQSIENLRIETNTNIDYDIVEFCINSCIKNNFKKVLFVGNVGIYEIITISNKAENKAFVEKENFPLEEYIKNSYKSKYNHDLTIIDKLNDQYDALISINSFNNYSSLFKEYEQFIKNRGMFIFANTKKNKKERKFLINEIHKFKYKYDMLKWNNGFVIVVKEKED